MSVTGTTGPVAGGKISTCRLQFLIVSRFILFHESRIHIKEGSYRYSLPCSEAPLNVSHSFLSIFEPVFCWLLYSIEHRANVFGLALQNIIAYPLHSEETENLFHVPFLAVQAGNYTWQPAGQLFMSALISMFGDVWRANSLNSRGAKWSIPQKFGGKKFTEVVH